MQSIVASHRQHASAVAHYGGDMFAEADRYAHVALILARQETFDVVHAHDWQAGLAPLPVTIRTLYVGGDKPLPGDPPHAIPDTARALHEFQRNAGLVSDGIAGAQTLDALQRLGALAAGSAHELRNAFVAVKTFVELLLERNPDPEVSAVLRRELVRIDALSGKSCRAWRKRFSALGKSPRSRHSMPWRKTSRALRSFIVGLAPLAIREHTTC